MRSTFLALTIAAVTSAAAVASVVFSTHNDPRATAQWGDIPDLVVTAKAPAHMVKRSLNSTSQWGDIPDLVVYANRK